MTGGARRLDRRPRVVLLAPTPPPYMGPSVATTVLLGSRFVEAFEVVHLDTSDRRGLDKLGALDLRNVALALRHFLQLLWALVATRPDCVYVPVSQTTIGFLRDALFIWPALLFRARVILHLRGGRFDLFHREANAPTRWLVRQTLARVAAMIVLGERLKPDMARLMPADRVFVVPNGLDLPPLDRQDAGGDGRPFTVLYLGNLIRSKGWFVLLEAAALAVRRNPGCAFTFAGAWMSAEDEREARAFVEEHGLAGHVAFLGTTTGAAKAACLAGADVLAFPTFYPYEGHPWVIVEAMAAGLPVISTDHACIPETVEHGVSGFIVPKQDPETLAARILELAGDPARRRAMGEASLRIYRERYTAEHFVAGMIRVFEAVLGTRPR